MSHGPSSRPRTPAVALAALLALGAPAAAAGPAGAGSAAGELAARVNGVGITRAEFERNWEYFLERSGIPAGHADKGGELVLLRRQVLDELVSEELLAQEAARLGYAAAAGEVAAGLAAARSDFPGEEQFRRAVAESGLDGGGLERLLARRIAIEKYVGAEVSAKLEVTDAEVSAFYRENVAGVAQPERARARHILVAVAPGAGDEARRAARERAAELLERVRAGADFAALAREHSDCPSAAAGGDLGIFPRGQMVGPFDAAVFALEPGQVADLVETPFGFHVVRREERLAAGVAPEDEVAPRIRERLLAERRQRAVVARVEQLRAAAEVEILLGD